MVTLKGESVGVFRGFSDSGLEFRAEVVAPYHSELKPMIGEFLLVEVLGTEAILGRITRFFPVGILSGAQGEDYLTTLSRLKREMPEDVKEDRLRYNVNLRLLGSIALEGGILTFIPGVRALPHLGADVAKPTLDVLRFICSLGCEAGGEPVDFGHMAVGSTVFDGEKGRPKLSVRFDLKHLISKRSFVFARAGYGKSNLVKLLVAKLYEKPRDVGMLIFDPEGEYAFSTGAGVPGLTDIPYLQDRILVFTDRTSIPARMRRFVGGRPRLNLKSLMPPVVVSNCLPPEKQETVFAGRLRGLFQEEWERLIDLLVAQRYRASDEEIQEITSFRPEREGAQISAIKGNLVPVIGSLHDQNSDIVNQVMYGLRRGYIVIVDVSTLSRANSERLAGIVMSEIFHHNQNNFVGRGTADMVKTIAVIEEAQAVLSPDALSESPFVVWAKEGRKYGLGAIMITQQPGAIADELLSQGDNFFAFHLISSSDLARLRRANAHYSSDILAAIVNEPIKGNCYYWSSPDQPFVLCAKITKFEEYVQSIAGTSAETVQEADAETVIPSQDEAEEVAEEELSETAVPHVEVESGQLTPAQEYRRVYPGLKDEFDKCLKGALFGKENVRITGKVTLDGEQQDGVVAVGYWNLSLETAKSLGPEARQRFAKPFRDSSDMFILQSFVQESLERLEMSVDPPLAYFDTKPYFLLKRDRMKPLHGKSIRDDLSIDLTCERGPRGEE